MHYEVEVTPNPIAGPIFHPVHNNGEPVRYTSKKAASIIKESFYKITKGVLGYQARIVKVDNGFREIVG